MRAQWEREKEQAEGHGKLRERLDEARRELERAERELNYQRAAELRHGEIPDLEARLAERRGAARRSYEPPVYLSERVDVEEIAEVVGKWTGIPVSRLVEGEVEKLIHMEERLHKRVIGQEEAVEAVSDALRRSRAGLSRPRPPDRHVPVPRPDRRRQDRAGARAGRVHVRLPGRDGPHRHVRVHGEALRRAARRARLPATSATRRAAS